MARQWDIVHLILFNTVDYAFSAESANAEDGILQQEDSSVPMHIHFLCAPCSFGRLCRPLVPAKNGRGDIFLLQGCCSAFLILLCLQKSFLACGRGGPLDPASLLDPLGVGIRLVFCGDYRMDAMGGSTGKLWRLPNQPTEPDDQH
jgi:hypothetical protein